MWSKKVLDEWIGKDRLNFGSLREERFIRGKKFKHRLLVIVYPQDYIPKSARQYIQVKITDYL